MPNLPEAHIGHYSNGRLRVKIPDKRGDEDFFHTLETRLRGWNSIQQVTVNPLTGSVLVTFDDPQALFTENAMRNDMFAVDFDELAALAEPVPSVIDWTKKRMSGADEALRGWTSGAADIRGTVFLLLVGAGVVQAVRGNIAAPAATLLWYAGAVLGLWDAVPEVKEAVDKG